jgi:Ca2+-binding EF-hand superfamily protein
VRGQREAAGVHRNHALNRQILPPRAEIALRDVPIEGEKPCICWAFRAARQLLDICRDHLGRVSAALGSVVMFFAAGAVGAAAVGALDLLSSLTPDKSNAAKTGVKQTNSLFDLGTTTSATNTATITSSTPTQTGALSPSTFNALLSAQNANGKANPSDALKDLFAQIDTNGDGKITKAEFEDKLGAGGTNIAAADNVFDKMDADSDGSVSLDEMASALKPKGGHPHAHRAGGGADALMQALQGASSTSTTNSDGSITTTLTYGDGSKITISQPAAAGTSTSASSQYNLVDKMMQRQTDALAAAAKQSVSVKV